MVIGVLGMVASGVGSWSVGGRIIANVGLIYKLAVWLRDGSPLLTVAGFSDEKAPSADAALGLYAKLPIF